MNRSLSFLKKLRVMRAFTLVEMMVAAGAVTVLLSSVVVTGVQLQRSFAVNQEYTTGAGKVLLVADSISVDVRRAMEVTVAGENQLTLRIPNYYQADGKTRRDPTIQLVTRPHSRTYEIYYGSAIDQYVEVEYFEQNGFIYRRETPSGGAAQAPLNLGENVDFEALYDPVARRVALDVNFRPTVRRTMGGEASIPIFVVVDLFLRN